MVHSSWLAAGLQLFVDLYKLPYEPSTMNHEPINKNMGIEINRILKLFAGLQHGD
jgi:hypothetical protein